MRTTTALLGTVMLLVSVGTVPSVAQESGSVQRLAGQERISTAVEVSRAGWAQAGTVVVATAADFPDALSGGALAAAVDGPLLLTWPDDLPPAASAEIERLQADRIIVLGGGAAVSLEVEAQLAGLAHTERIAGADRFDTAARVARQAVAEAAAHGRGTDEVVVASGTRFPDALSAASLYAAGTALPPILLVVDDVIPPATTQALDELAFDRARVVGGTAVVGEAVSDALGARHGLAVHRLAGPDRYGTSVEVAAHAMASAPPGPRPLVIATGEGFADALAAGAYTAAVEGTLLLVPQAGLIPALRDLISGQRANVDRAVVVGGPSAVSESVVDELRDLLDGPSAPPPGGGDRDDPHAVGVVVRLADGWDLAVRSSIPDGTDLVLAENQFNDPPGEGNQYFLVEVRATNRRDEVARFDGSFRLRTIGPGNVAYTTFSDSCGVIPDELVEPQVYPGGTVEGYLCWEVRSSDADGLVMFDRGGHFDDTHDRYFEVHGTTAAAPFPSPPPPPAGPVGSRGNPHPADTIVDLHDDWQVRVVGAEPDATETILAENQFNDPPDEGTQFFMARVRVTYRGSGSERFDDSRLGSVGHAGAVTYRTFIDSCGVIPDPIPFNELQEGGTVEGNICWQVRSPDADTLVAVDVDFSAPEDYRPHLALQ